MSIDTGTQVFYPQSSSALVAEDPKNTPDEQFCRDDLAYGTEETIPTKRSLAFSPDARVCAMNWDFNFSVGGSNFIENRSRTSRHLYKAKHNPDKTFSKF